MAFRVNGNLEIKFQGLDLNCGFYCLEAVMRWKHGTPYGVDVGGRPRNAHTAAVQNHLKPPRSPGFDPGDHLNDYGLVRLLKPWDAARWEMELKDRGPLIVGGHIGAVRIIPLKKVGHFVVVVGVTAGNKIEYYDPLRPGHSLGTGQGYDPVQHANYGPMVAMWALTTGPEKMSAKQFTKLADDDEVYGLPVSIATQ